MPGCKAREEGALEKTKDRGMPPGVSSVRQRGETKNQGVDKRKYALTFKNRSDWVEDIEGIEIEWDEELFKILNEEREDIDSVLIDA